MSALSSMVLLRCVSETYDTVILPTLKESPARSAAHSMAHLLRYAIVQMRERPKILAHEIVILETLLRAIAAYKAAVPSAEASPVLLDSIDTAPTLEAGRSALLEESSSLEQRCSTLRLQLYDSLRWLQQLRSSRGLESAYQELRQRIRDYIRWEIEQQDKLIEAAFAGRGPRR
jgi:hypothetical protein